ncbi:MAG: tetratricopeptide repeat protein [Acidobacteriota bacterium]
MAERGLLVVVVLLSSLLVVGPAMAQRGTGRVQGRVTDSNGNNLEGVKVTAFNAGRTPSSLIATTDKNGRWAILGLGTDAWEFTFEKEGYISYVTHGRIRGMGGNPDLDVTLEVAAATTATGVSAANVKDPQLFKEGNQLYEQGDYASAIARWQEFMTANPDLSQVNVNVGNAYREMGKTEEAKAAYKKVLSADANNAAALYNLAEILVSQGNADEALPYFERVLESSPDDPAIYYNVAEVYFSKGVTDRAIEYYQGALKVDPEYVPAHKQIGFAYINIGDTTQAIAAFEKFLEMAPADNPDVGLVKDILAALKSGP